MPWQRFQGSQYTSIHDQTPPDTIEPFRSCYASDGNGGIRVMLMDDPTTGRTLDCPYPPSLGSSAYPGQACSDGIRSSMDAIGRGIGTDDPNFPLPPCPSNGDTLPDWILPPGVTPPSDPSQIDCRCLSVQYMPNEKFDGCVPIVHVPRNRSDPCPPRAASTPQPIYYPTREACETDCRLSSNPDRIQQDLTDALRRSDQPPFCLRLPFCTESLSDADNSSGDGRPSIVSSLGCLQRQPDGSYYYRVLPSRDEITCSKLFGILPKSA